MLHRSQWTFRALQSLKFHALHLAPVPCIWYILSQCVTNLQNKCAFNVFKIVQFLSTSLQSLIMAKMVKAQNSLDEIPSCQVCFEEFTYDGAHVPRLLPCTHTLCHTCVGQLIRENGIECPECRKKYEAKNEENSFPQNKYILVQMKERSPKPHHTQPETCRQHGKDLNIFCTEPGCQMIICLLCFSREHIKHKVIDAEEKMDEVIDTLQENMKAVAYNLRRKMRIITVAKEDATTKIVTNLEELKKKKQDMIQHFDKMIQDSEDQMKEIKVKTNQDLNAMNETLDLLFEIKESTEAIEGVTFRDIIKKRDTMSSIIENVNKQLTGTRTYDYCEYTISIDSKTVKKQMVVEINEEINGLKPSLTFHGEMTKFTQTIITTPVLRGKKLRLNPFDFPIVCE